MKNKKVLLIGNSSCVNRGDAAILDGLLQGINDMKKEDIEITATSFHYFESQILLNYPLEPDFSYKIGSNLFFRFSIFKKIWNKYFLFYDILILAILARYGSNYVPKKFRTIRDEISKYDVIIQVGGSYFVDLYTPLKYVSVAISILQKKAIYFAGHSVGPFESWKSRLLPKLLFKKVNKIYLREAESLKHMSTINANSENVVVKADTAWLIGDSKDNPVFHNEVISKKPLIAITIRDLKPFDRRLGITQEDFENLFVESLNKLIDQGYHIVGVSMGTGFAKYPHDDRIPAFRLKSRLNNPKEMTVLMHEYDHLEIGYVLSQCKLLIGTRLHSVILSLRYNTPAIAIYYEHKSLGILNKMNFDENSFFIKDIGTDRFNSKINDILNNDEKQKAIIKEKVERERELGFEMIKEIFI